MTTSFNVLEAAQKHKEMLELVHRTHQIFCGIKGKDILLLSADPPGRTDVETFISLPMEDPEADKIHKHEWQHIFFKSNLRARESFADSYSDALKKRLPMLDQMAMKDFIHMLVNGLDDIRVCSLWELIYPYSADEVQKRWCRIIVSSGRYQQDLVMYLMGLGLGLDQSMHRSEWIRYKSVLKDSVEKVIRRGFPTCLLAARWIIESILQDVTMQHLTPSTHSVLPPKPVQFIPSAAPAQASKFGGQPSMAGAPVTTPEEGAKQATALSKLYSGVRPGHRAPALQGSWKMMDTDVIPSGPDPEWKATEDMVRVAMGVSAPQQVELVLKQSQLDVDKIISELKNRTKTLTPGQRLLKGMDGRAVMVDIKPSDVDDLELSEVDQKLVHNLRHSFMRLMDSKRQVSSDSGTTLNPQAYIDLLMGSADTDIFLEEENSKGFSAILLLDMSGSMQSKWGSVARACKVVAKAMKFPFSRLEVWGFTSPGDGTATILRFEDTGKGYTGPGVKDVWGLTPLHIAVEVALRRLQAMPGSAQHLIILTDGYPTHLSSNRSFMAGTDALFVEIARHISNGRKKGVNVVGLISGSEIDDLSANAMFGHKRFWWRVPEQPEYLFQALVGLARKSFVGYLRSK